jgi:hypothetical protein
MNQEMHISRPTAAYFRIHDLKWERAGRLRGLVNAFVSRGPTSPRMLVEFPLLLEVPAAQSRSIQKPIIYMALFTPFRPSLPERSETRRPRCGLTGAEIEHPSLSLRITICIRISNCSSRLLYNTSPNTGDYLLAKCNRRWVNILIQTVLYSQNMNQEMHISKSVTDRLGNGLDLICQSVRFLALGAVVNNEIII